MKSLQNLYEQIGKITKDTTTDSVAQYKICALRSWKFLETTRTITTVASQEAYDLPENYRRVIDVYLTSGTTIYSPKPIIKEEDYKKLKSQNLGASDALQYYYIDQGQIRFLPAPATVSLSITLRYRRRPVDLSADDYATGTVTLTNADETVTGSGTTFTAGMAGRWLRATTGDYKWYEIDTFTTTTALEMVKKYNGTTTAGLTYVIGEMPLIPEDYQMLLEYKPLSMYYAMNQDTSLANYWDAKYKELLQLMIAEQNKTGEQLPSDDLPLYESNILDRQNYENILT